MMRTVDKVRFVLNALFLFGAIATLIVFLTMGKCPTFMYLGFGTLAIKVFEFILRFVN